MNTWSPFGVTALLTGVVTAGEALALLIGMRVLSQPGNPWISAKNDLLLALDILVGLGLIWLAWRGPSALGSALFWLVTAAGLLSHGFRDWEYLITAANRFLANGPLFVVNNLKLLGFLIVAILGLGSKAPR
jgi:hypothetical protein